MALTAAQERKKRKCTGRDCVAVRVDGETVFYACFTHVFSIMADIQQGDETMWVDLWSIPDYLIDAAQKIKCVYHDR